MDESNTPVWQRWLNSAKDYGRAVQDRIEYLRDLPEQASDKAEQLFPGYERDSSTKNTFRHALGTGMLAQEIGNSLGGSMPAKLAGAVAAKLAGYGWEAPTQLSPFSSAAERQDSLHDLNANAEGASMAMTTNNQADLVQALAAMARNSRQVNPPGAFSYGPGYLTRTER